MFVQSLKFYRLTVPSNFAYCANGFCLVFVDWIRVVRGDGRLRSTTGSVRR